MNNSKLAKRTKPQLTPSCERFRVLYNMLPEIPMGPDYLGFKTFEVDRLTEEAITYIQEHQTELTVVEITKYIIEELGLFVRAETVSTHFTKNDDTVLWQKKSIDYVNRHEKVNNVGRGPIKKRANPQIYYRPFIEWCIENNYEYFQISEVIARAPNTLRLWANRYGYKEFEIVRTKTPDLNGKHGRSEKIITQSDINHMLQVLNSDKGIQLPIFQEGEMHIDKSTTIVASNPASQGTYKIFDEIKNQVGTNTTPSSLLLGVKKNTDMTLHLPTRPGNVPLKAYEAINAHITWREAAKADKCPDYLHVIELDSVKYIFEQKRMDPFNGHVWVELLTVVNS